jgi:hypothetical protein
MFVRILLTRLGPIFSTDGVLSAVCSPTATPSLGSSACRTTPPRSHLCALQRLGAQSPAPLIIMMQFPIDMGGDGSGQHMCRRLHDGRNRVGAGDLEEQQPLEDRIKVALCERKTIVVPIGAMAYPPRSIQSLHIEFAFPYATVRMHKPAIRRCRWFVPHCAPQPIAQS